MRHQLAEFAAQHTLGLSILVPAAMLMDDRRCAVSLARDPWDNPATRAAALSALGFLAYNFLSLSVLLLIDAVSHSVCNTCRRAVTIVDVDQLGGTMMDQLADLFDEGNGDAEIGRSKRVVAELRR